MDSWAGILRSDAPVGIVQRALAAGTRDSAGRGRGAANPKASRELASMPEHDPKTKAGPDGHSRRDFLRGSGLAAASAVLTGTAVEALDEAKAAAAQAGPKVLKGDVDIT